MLKDQDLTVMAALLEETQLDRSIDAQGQFTLFAPTDLAFNQFLQKLGGVKEVSQQAVATGDNFYLRE